MLQEQNLDIVERTVQIEADIAEQLRRGESVGVDKGMLENGYTILDATDGEMPGTLHEKCAAIVSVLRDKYSIEAEYSILDGTVAFAPAAAKGHATSESD